MNNTTRKDNFNTGWIGEIPEKEETKNSEEIQITAREIDEIFKKLNIDGRKGITVDKETFEKIEAYIAHLDSLSSYKKRIAKKELEKYIVPTSDIIEECSGSYCRSTSVKTYINGKKIGIINLYGDLRGNGHTYTIMRFRDFKYLIAGTTYNYLSEAFSTTGDDSENDKYIDFYLWLLDKGGSAKMYETFFDEKKLRIRLP